MDVIWNNRIDAATEQVDSMDPWDLEWYPGPVRHAVAGPPRDPSEWEDMKEWAEHLPVLPAHMYDHELLSAEQECILAERIQAGLAAEGSAEVAATRRGRRTIQEGKLAQDILVRANLRLARAMSSTIVSSLPDEDRDAFGFLGLMRAALTFDPTRGRFSTYATWWIRQHTRRGTDDTERLIRIPVHAVDTLNAARRVQREMTTEIGRAPTLSELASQCDDTPQKISWLLAISRPPISLDDWMDKDSSTRTADWWSLLAPSELEFGDPFEQAEDDMCRAAVRDVLEQYVSDVELHRIPDPGVAGASRAMEMLRLRIGMVDGEEWTLDRVGRRFDITRERVRQIVGKLMEDPILRQRIDAAARTVEVDPDSAALPIGPRKRPRRCSRPTLPSADAPGARSEPPSSAGAATTSAATTGRTPPAALSRAAHPFWLEVFGLSEERAPSDRRPADSR